MTTYNTDHLIIGFGKGGKTLAKTLASKGENVILVEQSAKMYGGTCINIGCIPTKKLKHLAEQGSEFHTAILQKNELIGKLNQANFEMIDKVATVITGKADFIDAHTVQVTTDSDTHTITAKHIYINTGAKSPIPNIDGIHSTQGIYDSTGIMNLAKKPDTLVIVGSGYIGLEFASIFTQFGVKVTVLDLITECLPREDRDVAEALQKIMENQGITFKFNQSVQAFKNVDNQVVIQTEETELKADAVLIATGRVANTDFNPKNAGIELGERGFVKVNKHLQTSQPHIYAMGDVAGSPQFTYMSLDDFRVVKSHLLGDGSYTTENRTFPYTVFTNPPLSVAGLSENAAKMQGINVKTATLSANAIPKAKIIQQTEGVLKAVINADNNKVIGAQLLCAESHEMINFMDLAIRQGMSASDIANYIFTHPTMSESLNDLFGQF
ncbi:pyridine nucleotide-disulfide oxidoreductase [Moraxella macacae 0408225]|uniref:Pyridine nucleotide-disulfide oxidoreductase n=1 Tax=Moraxella macacae 0408225 TaxID=1230338 RepID=L2F9K5_9GAMM|nr:FAD-dependent oxidoreductase [Moraxella macacae]ELA09456.1 pyridine nucleotide-disulfide oxidoreductase [Moraxella macacae 0408225]